MYTSPCFSALQRAENSSMHLLARMLVEAARFSALQRAENSSIIPDPPARRSRFAVSVLFSEPKIPQSRPLGIKSGRRRSFSALQRAENSSIETKDYAVEFRGARFSALQRAENSSILLRAVRLARRSAFQCSSASRKFLNCSFLPPGVTAMRFQCSSASRKFLNGFVSSVNWYSRPSFSALQRAENSSMMSLTRRNVCLSRVSVLFSEPKIPQWMWYRKKYLMYVVSVLFSEPKIPQSPSRRIRMLRDSGFSALQRAENSSI